MQVAGQGRGIRVRVRGKGKRHWSRVAGCRSRVADCGSRVRVKGDSYYFEPGVYT